MSPKDTIANHDSPERAALKRWQAGPPAHNHPSLAGWIPLVILALSVIGFADASYLSVKHFQGVAPTCVLFSGCDVVTTSEYATIGPVPIAVLGALFYLTILILSVTYLDRKSERAIQLVALISIPGFLFTLWLLYLQLFVVNALCFYCVASGISSALIFVLAQVAWRSIGGLFKDSP